MDQEKQAIFIGATGQDVGKTTLCLGLIAALKKRFGSVGFIKPIGQHHVRLSNGIKVDKDALLFHDNFQLDEEWKTISPVILPSGFTRDFLDGKITESALLQSIIDSFQTISSQNRFTLVEGTGHVGVGSIIQLNNAKVAAALGLKMVLIATGGLGSAFDELALNIEMCRTYGVEVKGIILNRVLENKRAMVAEYFPKALRSWGIPLLGCVPYNELLSLPTMRDFETLFQTTLLSGQEQRFRHYPNHRLVAGSLQVYLDQMTQNELVITPASREEIVEALLEKHASYKRETGEYFGCGLILTSMQPPSELLLKKIKSSDVPVLYAPVCSYDAMVMLASLKAKIRREDTSKIEKAIQLVEESIDINQLLCAQPAFV